MKHAYNIFDCVHSQNIPYWAEIADFEERQQAYLIYQEKQNLEKELLSIDIKNKTETFKI